MTTTIGREIEKDTTYIILLNMGGPEQLDDVPQFLYNLFADRKLIQIPFPASLFQNSIARMIAKKRSEGTKQMYSQIGGGSPIYRITRSLADKIEKNLQMTGEKVKVEIVMRYTPPRANEVVEDVIENANRIILFPQYPHYAEATTGSSIEKFLTILQQHANGREYQIEIIEDWSLEEFYIDWWVEGVKDSLNELEEEGIELSERVHVIFSAHGLPIRYIKKGEVYQERVENAYKQIVNRLHQYKGKISFHMAYQSRVGPMPWLQPYTDELIEELAEKDAEALIMVPLGFVTDHVETLYEIDILYCDLAKSKGIPRYLRAPVPNDDDNYARKMTSMIVERYLRDKQ